MQDRVLTAQTLDQIARFHGEGLPVVSAYLGVKGVADARRALQTKTNSLLHRVRSLADDMVDATPRIHPMLELRGHLTAAWLWFALPPIPETT